MINSDCNIVIFYHSYDILICLMKDQWEINTEIHDKKINKIHDKQIDKSRTYE